jgi:hypothetical protein
MSSCPTFTRPAYVRASSATTGASARQGGHHVAPKSINTGEGDRITSASKLESVNVAIGSMTMGPP